MGERTAWVDASKGGNRLGFAEPGAVVDAHGTANTATALVGDGFCIEGSVDDLRRFLLDALAVLPGGQVLYAVTRGDVEERAGRPVTDDEADRIGRAIEHSTVSECVEGAVEQVVGFDDLDDDLG